MLQVEKRKAIGDLQVANRRVDRWSEEEAGDGEMWLWLWLWKGREGTENWRREKIRLEVKESLEWKRPKPRRR